MASSLYARIDGEREAKQLLQRPPVVRLEKSGMCQNKYTIECVSKTELLCTLSHVWPFGLRHLGFLVYYMLFIHCVVYFGTFTFFI